MLLDPAVRYFRSKRMRRFEHTFGITAVTRILDVGGTPLNWSFLSVRPRLTILNMPRAKEPVPPDVAWVAADGRALPFRDQSYDIVFSNSVIEHLGSRADQRRFAAEVARVGVRYWVQTPNRWFPVEPHLLTPLLHFLPKKWQGRIARRFTVWDWIARPSADRWDYYVNHYLNDIRLLDVRELRTLFPDCDLIEERFLGWSRSLIAARKALR